MFSSLKQAGRRMLRKLLRRYAPWELEAGLAFLSARQEPHFAPQNVRVSDEVQRETLLVLAPHPDDEAIGPGGLICRLLEVGSAVTVVYLTDGGGCQEPRAAMIAARRAEAERLGTAFGLRQEFWEITDTKLVADEATIGRLVELLDRLRPTMIALPAPTDHHRDHQAACELAAGALRLRPDLAPQVVCYEVWDNLPWPNYVLDISRQFARKAEMIALHETPCRVTDFVQLARERAALRFKLHINSERAAAEQGYAEAFWRLDAASFCELSARFPQLGK